MGGGEGVGGGEGERRGGGGGVIPHSFIVVKQKEAGTKSNMSIPADFYEMESYCFTNVHFYITLSYDSNAFKS